ncbi:hypothetical protein B4113_3337 [Geobacillus sp. B4113_201601]|nr:hypothetical protein B4113_3337 [Geobacillus sp. B4113_201601]
MLAYLCLVSILMHKYVECKSETPGNFRFSSDKSVFAYVYVRQRALLFVPKLEKREENGNVHNH